MKRKIKLGALAAIVAAFGVTACDDQTVPVELDVPEAPSLDMTLDVSDVDAPVGSKITVGIRAASRILGGLQGQLDFSAERLEYVGQEAGDNIALVNANERGRVRVVSFSVEGLPEYSAKLVFEVTGSGYAGGLRFSPEIAVAVDETVLAVPRNIYARETAGLVASDVRVMDSDAWLDHLYPGMMEGVLRSPGQACNDERDSNGNPIGPPVGSTEGCASTFEVRYGDCRLDNTVDIQDALKAARIGAGLDSLIENTSLTTPDIWDAVKACNVRPANLPGLGEAGDDVPPGYVSFPDNAGSVDVQDALGIALEGAGLPSDIAGELMPGREAFGGVCTDVWPAGVYRNAAWPAGAPGAGSGTVQMPATPGCIQIIEGVMWIGNQDFPNSVDAAGKLEIAEGTRVEGTDAAAILISRNGIIDARGTQLEPIVMTCVGEDVGGTTVRAPGCWGGLAIAGNSGVVEQQANIDPSPPVVYPDGTTRAATVGCNTRELEGNGPEFGGCVQDDSSGVLQYAVIMYGGREVLPNNELNVLTVGGVGSRTVIDHVQMAYGLDDCYEAFGGSVNAKYMYMYQCTDDHLDVSFGYKGVLQYVIVDRSGGDKGIEADHTETLGTYDTGIHPEEPHAPDNVLTRAMIFNATFVGDGAQEVARTRRGTAYHLYNSFLSGSAELIDIDDDATCTELPHHVSHPQDGRTGLVYWESNYAADYGTAGSLGCAEFPLDHDIWWCPESSPLYPSCTPVPGKPTTAAGLLFDYWYNVDLGAATPINTILVEPYDPLNPDYRVRNDGPLSGASGILPSELLVPGNPDGNQYEIDALAFLDDVDFIGAAPPAGTAGNNIGWWMGWTAPDLYR